MKANLKNNKGVELNIDYLQSVNEKFSYFYVPDHAMSAELFRSVNADGPITGISRYGSEQWQVQVLTEMIEWED